MGREGSEKEERGVELVTEFQRPVNPTALSRKEQSSGREGKVDDNIVMVFSLSK